MACVPQKIPAAREMANCRNIQFPLLDFLDHFIGHAAGTKIAGQIHHIGRGLVNVLYQFKIFFVFRFITAFQIRCDNVKPLRNTGN